MKRKQLSNQNNWVGETDMENLAYLHLDFAQDYSEITELIIGNW